MGGDPKPADAYKSTAGSMKAFSEFYPKALEVLTQGILPNARAEIASQEEIAPRQAALENRITRDYGGEAARIASDIDNQVLRGVGGQTALAAQDLQRRLDPEYYRAREQMSKGIGDLLGSIDVNKLSGSERAEVERSLAQDAAKRGTGSAPSNIESVQNAMMFGSALQNKRNALGQALQTATGVTPQLRGGLDAASIALRRPSNFSGVQGVSQTAQGFGQNFLNQNFAAQSQFNQLNADRRDSLDRINETMGTVGNMVGAIS